jgi:hypothetical protein
MLCEEKRNMHAIDTEIKCVKGPDTAPNREAAESNITDQSLQDSSYRRYLCLLCLAVVLLSCPLFIRQSLDQCVSDFYAHIGFVKTGVETGKWQPHFLFHWLVYALAGFQSRTAMLTLAAVVLVLGCLLAKAWLSYRLLWQSSHRTPTCLPANLSWISPDLFVALTTVGLLIAAPIWDPLNANMYIGRITPNVWHNPTCFMVWPFVILLFIAGVNYLDTAKTSCLLGIGVLAALNVLAKPNYLLAFAPVFVLASFMRFRFSRQWFAVGLAFVPCLAILLLQYYFTYAGPQHSRGMIIAPFAVWKIYSVCIPLGAILSVAFPASYLCLFWRSLREPRHLLFAWAVFGVAMVWMIVFAEINPDGSINTAFNFGWGAILSFYVVFLFTMCDFLSQPANCNKVLHRIVWVLFLAHVVCGAVWLFRQTFGFGFF